jgi:hypothetical protein
VALDLENIVPVDAGSSAQAQQDLNLYEELATWAHDAEPSTPVGMYSYDWSSAYDSYTAQLYTHGYFQFFATTMYNRWATVADWESELSTAVEHAELWPAGRDRLRPQHVRAQPRSDDLRAGDPGQQRLLDQRRDHAAGRLRSPGHPRVLQLARRARPRAGRLMVDHAPDLCRTDQPSSGVPQKAPVSPTPRK